MTATNREVAISKTLTYEGGFTNNKKDRGGPTNWGITIHDARLHWKPDATVEDVKNMPKSVAIDIYRKKYWAVMGCDERPSGPSAFEFDTGVNSGVGRVFVWRKTLDAQHLSPVEYVKAFSAKRSSFLHSLRAFKVFGKGWSRRVADLEAFCVRMAVGAAGKPVAPILRKEAERHAKRAIAHSTASASTPLAAHGMHFDLTTVSGWIFLAVLSVGVVYFVWNAVQASHRTDAYQAQLKQA